MVKNIQKIIWLSVGFVFLFSFCLVMPVEAGSATLYLLPSTGNYTVGSNFSVVVKVSSGGVPINAAEGSLTFNPDEISVVSLSKNGSIFTLWTTQPTFSNAAGTIEFGGGTPASFTGAAGTIITITFRARRSATANVNFISGAVLAADGKGTNILANMRGGVYTFRPGIITPPAEEEEYVLPPTPARTPAAPIISSITHPEPEKWYSNNDPEFSWQLPPDVTAVRLLINRAPRATPAVLYVPPISERKLEDLVDGVWYFHVQFRNQYGWGGILHRKVLIDTEDPEPFEITVDNEGDPTNPAPIFHFKTTDVPSGIEYYEILIKQEDRTIITATITNIPYRPLPLPPGKYEVVVRAFDKAGNLREASTEFEILPIPPPKITKIPNFIRIGETLRIEGEAAPEITVRIYILRVGEEEPILEKVKADLEGKFVLVYDRLLAEGDYLVWTQSEDERGALSEPTKKYPLEVGLPPFLRIGKIVIDYLTTVITLIILVVGALTVIFYTWYKISLWRKRARRETKEVEESVERAFRALREEVGEQIEFLDGKPGLNEDERKVRDKLKEALNISEKFISKEIKDVKKELE